MASLENGRHRDDAQLLHQDSSKHLFVAVAYQESWTLLNSSGVGCLAGVEDGLIREKLTAMLARTLEVRESV